MNCPICGSDMWDNSVNKKYPTAPDFRCRKGKETGCLGAYYKQADGTYANLNPKTGKPLQAPRSQPVTPPIVSALSTVNVQPTPQKVAPVVTRVPQVEKKETVPLSMRGRWPVDIIVALIRVGVVKTAEDAVEKYGYLLGAINGKLHGGSSTVVPPVVPVSTPVTPTVAAPVVTPLPVGVPVTTVPSVQVDAADIALPDVTADVTADLAGLDNLLN